MAYKFQIGAGLYSGSLEARGPGKFTSGDFQDGNLTNVGAIYADSIGVADASDGLKIEFSGSTATNKIQLTDNLAEALTIEQGGNDYLKFVTTNSSESILLGKTLTASAGIGAHLGGALTVAGNVAGVDNLDGAGDLTMATITMPGFTVDADGDTALKSLLVDDGSTIGCDSDTDLLTLADGALTIAGSAAATVLSGSGTATLYGLNVGQSVFTVSNEGAVVTQGLSATGVISGSGTATLYGLNVGQSVFTVSNEGAVVTQGLSAAGISGSGQLTANDLTITEGTLLSGDVALSGASDHAVAVGADSIYFLDVTSGKVRRDTFADLASAMAGAGITATAGVLSTDGGAVTTAYSGKALVEGYNYVAAALTASHAVTLPASPDVGDVVTLKSHASASATNYVAVTCAGSHLIDKEHETVRLESPFGAITFVYVVANDWRIV
mgnify:CR=1 FL=1